VSSLVVAPRGAPVDRRDPRERSALARTLEGRDLPWIRELIDVVVRAEGRPWRIALDELERSPAPAAHLAAVTSAVRKLVGGRAAHARVARDVRAMVLGRPALSAAERDARLDGAARKLGIPPDELEPLLWSDLPRERAIELHDGRPDELTVAAHANVQLVQRALGRAHGIHLRLWGDDGSVLRAALARGLLVTATREVDHTALAIAGPLALCHRTAVYGRALGQIVPQLAACERFELAIDAGAFAIAIASPVLLPVAPADRAGGALARALARDLARIDRTLSIAFAPPPIAAGRVLVCPDLVAGDMCIELVGFWTAEYLAKKLARYRAAGAEVVLCVDETRGAEPLPSGVIGYKRRVDAAAVFAALADLVALRSRSCRSPGA
jgi:predicted nuclease of restriction endonuclease-like RecB superfamily